jgi:hypothetical protein
MCQQVIILAERAGWRYVSQCEHGTVHLVWDAIGIHLPASAFVELYFALIENRSLLTSKNSGSQFNRSIATHILDTSYQLRAEANAPKKGHCRLQVGRLAVELPLPEFLPFADMVREALPQVDLLAGGPPCQSVQLAFPQLNLAPVLN